MNTGGYEIGKDLFLIAEAGINHNGSVQNAMDMIEAARLCGCNCVKFQTFKAEEVCDDKQTYTYRSQGKEITESRQAMSKRVELPDSAWSKLRNECYRKGLIFLSTPETPSDVDILMEVGVPALKIASDNLTNLPMLRYCAKTGLPLILSCGMSDMSEVTTAVSIIGTKDNALLVCTSNYPTEPVDVNLARMTTLKNAFPSLEVGFSDHTLGNMAAVIAASLGASIFECHFTLSENLPGPDHSWSKTTEGLKQWVRYIKMARTMLGDGVVHPRGMEIANKSKFQRKVA